MQLLLLQNQLKNESGFHFIDSTPVSTCLNRRIFSHKVTKKIASHGKSTKGRFYGFKLHGVCSEKGLLWCRLSQEVKGTYKTCRFWKIHLCGYQTKYEPAYALWAMGTFKKTQHNWIWLGCIKTELLFGISTGKMSGWTFSSLCLLYFSLHFAMQTEILSKNKNSNLGLN